MIEYTIENRPPREPEIDEIIALMNRVWLDVYHDEGFFRFDRNLFDWYARDSFRRNDCFWLAFGAGSRRIIGFGLVMPRMMMVHGGGPYLFAYGSLITVDPEFQRRGIARAIWEQAAATGKSLGVKGSLALVEDGSKGLKTVDRDLLEHLLSLWTHEHAYIRPLAVGELGRYLNMKWYERVAVQLLKGVAPVDDPRIRDVGPGDHDGVRDLLNAYSRDLDLSRVWDLEELALYYANPVIRGKVLEVDGEVQAVVNAAVVPFSIKGHVGTIAIMENLHYERIPFADQRLLVRALLHDLKSAHVAFATDFGIGYSAPRPIRSNKFVKYVRKQTLYFFPVADPEDEIVHKLQERCGTTYIDVR